MFAELYSASKDFRPRLPRRQRLKQLAFRSSPLIAAATVATGALCAKKLRDPPDSDFIHNQVTFQCKPAQQFLARQEIAAAGGDVEALCRAARRMRGPVERDIAAAECLLAGGECLNRGSQTSSSSLHEFARSLQLEIPSKPGDSSGDFRQQLWSRLVEAWTAAGYFSEPVEFERPTPSRWAGLNPVSGEDEAYGRDVGCQVPLCMLRNDREEQAELHRASPEQWAPVSQALEQYGVVLLKDLIPESLNLMLRRHLQIHASALDNRLLRHRGPGKMPIREYDTEPLQDEDPELQYVTSSVGRKHYLLRGRLLEEVVSKVQAGALPVIWEHLASASASASSSKRCPYISEIQMVVTEPGALGQFWHTDNAFKGITLVVPITPMPEEMGPISFFPGSHHLFDSGLSYGARLQGCASSLLRSNGVAVAAMDAGDALLYDSRTIHRGELNRRYDRTGITLIFRYDFDRPPGYGAMGTVVTSWAGSALATFMNFYAKLPQG